MQKMCVVGDTPIFVAGERVVLRPSRPLLAGALLSLSFSCDPNLDTTNQPENSVRDGFNLCAGATWQVVANELYDPHGRFSQVRRPIFFSICDLS